MNRNVSKGAKRIVLVRLDVTRQGSVLKGLLARGAPLLPYVREAMSDWNKPDTIFLALLLLAFAWYSCGTVPQAPQAPPAPFVIDNAAAD